MRPTPIPTRRLMPIDEVRVVLGGIGRTKIYDLVSKGHLRIVKIGRRSFLVEEDVVAFIEKL